jgi:hypothetical protein
MARPSNILIGCMERVHMIKDIGIALELAKRRGIPAPLSAHNQELWRAAERYSGKGCSISEVVRWIEPMMHAELAPQATSGATE